MAGQSIELQAVAYSAAGTQSALSPLVSLRVGSEDVPIPAAIDASTIAVEPLLGGVRVRWAAGPDTASVQIYRAQTDQMDRAAHVDGDPIPIGVARTVTVVLGDGTRSNLVVGAADFADPARWTAGPGWSLSAGQASHAAGAAGMLRTPVTLQPGRVYRAAASIVGSAGSAALALHGLTPVLGPAQSGSARWSARLNADATSSAFGVSAGADFVGRVDDAVLFLETPSCLPPGTHFIWLEPLNSDGQPGPLSGPISVTID
ncbi:hypothetical protein ACEYYB_09655 [Paracoccus sp. p4-l81]|uniref:hypothetical protein n=1 Tax=Paracoccus sp. p4-l81 TaxID=3342806 RepID=UPI0035BADF84